LTRIDRDTEAHCALERAPGYAIDDVLAVGAGDLHVPGVPGDGLVCHVILELDPARLRDLEVVQSVARDLEADRDRVPVQVPFPALFPARSHVEGIDLRESRVVIAVDDPEGVARLHLEQVDDAVHGDALVGEQFHGIGARS